jgi:hypothetical protein
MEHHLKPMGFFDVLPLSKEKHIEYLMGQIRDRAPIYCERGNGFLSVPFDKFLKGRRQPFP